VARFDKGIRLYDGGAYAAALAEFLEARRIYPLRHAVYQAGLCLAKLQRYDEALEAFETALREVDEAAPALVKENLQRKVLEMRGLVGEIAVGGAEPGATVRVDGLSRGEHPLLSPLRVAAGSHLVQVFKIGFLPFEARVLIAGGTTEHLDARLSPLGPSGRIRIAEQHGRAIDVLVDGVRVGTAPWQGPLPPGPHLCALRGQGNLGTPPVQIRVVENRTTALTLEAEELSAALRVVPAPVNASVAVDGVSIGHGIWEGRLHAGRHRIEVSADGFLPAAEEVAIERDERREVRVDLLRDPRSSFARRPSRTTIEADVSLALAPLFGGEVASGCSGGCSGGVPAGGYAVVRAGRELAVGLGFGVSAGYLAASQRLRGRPAVLTVVGRPPETVQADDTLWLHAALLGAWAGLSLELLLPLHLRLGAGAVLGSASDTRSGSGASGTLEPSGQARPFCGAYVAPELRMGLWARGGLEVSAGIELIAAFAPSAPSWVQGPCVMGRGSCTVVTRPSLVETGTFPAQTFTGPVLAITPGIGTRYTF
jgi:hypothetical protein